jgi:hypothetical protein
MTVYIICHETLPNYPVPDDARIIWLNSVPPADHCGYNIINGYDYIENAEALHKKLAGALGPIIIKRVAEASSSNLVTIWQYRKFVTTTKYGSLSPDYPNMYVLTETMASTLRVSELDRADGNFLLCPPVNIVNLYQQYVSVHNIADLLRYVAIAIELGVITAEESFSFLTVGHLISGGIELGSFPTHWWSPTCHKVEQVSIAFANRYLPFQPEDPYQKRAIAFCQERLGSYLLIKELLARYNGDIPNTLFGTMHSVAADGVYRVGI